MQFKDQHKKKAITLSYDDGTTQDIQLIELLNKYGLKATFNLNSQRLGVNKIMIREGKRVSHYKIHPSDVRYVYEGHEIAAHTLDHPLLPKLDDAEVIRQVEQDRLNLSELAGYEVIGMAYPGGGVNNDQRVADLVKNHTGVRYARTITSTGNFDPQLDLYRFHPTCFHPALDPSEAMTLAKKFLEMDTDTPQIFYIWGHAFETEYHSDSWRQLEDFFDLISGHDDIFYGTNAEVLL